MYAVIETGGKQYRVELGTELEVELLDVAAGQSLDFERVLLVADGDEAAIGHPLVEGARVTADVLRQDRADKVIVFKYRPKARRRVKHGHRQEQTVVRVSDIVYGSKSAAKMAEDARTERQRLEQAAAEEAATRAASDKALADKMAADAAADTAAETAAAAEDAAKAAEPKTAKPSARKASTPKPAATKATKTAAPSSAAKPTSRTQAPEPEAKPKPRSTKKDE
jgi:large subunit ribosomal protein L21